MSSMPPPPSPSAKPISQPSANTESDKTFAITYWLSIVLGIAGVDRLYLGKSWTAVIKFLTFGGFGIWWLVDLVTVLRGATLDAQRRPLSKYPNSVGAYVIVTVLLFLVLTGFIVLAILYGEPGTSTGSL